MSRSPQCPKPAGRSDRGRIDALHKQRLATLRDEIDYLHRIWEKIGLTCLNISRE